ncbi:mRNA splicing factor [Heterostelium album PN500]|uniref:mRNA splicing factor n=1 Tax=Heterostelium pallidum (strain ATCC 26659 / Pp 5 / PN500) TaxID=670386 RepID=D3BSB8_HETP5|nr:mRNA splicing factor [Heterostelium album PN500]EFA75691.1 mRNA splicing factor [Heterostelium album PN500]|eukprot:XP_020427825.1 mRNA splicing factor [Heterostelium album PN500]
MTSTPIDRSAVEDIDWNALDKLKRNDLQRLCKEFSLPIKATSKNLEIIDALKSFKAEYDSKQKVIQEQEKKKQSTVDDNVNSKINDSIESTVQQADVEMTNNNENTTTTTTSSSADKEDDHKESKKEEEKEDDSQMNIDEPVLDVQDVVEQSFTDSLPIPIDNDNNNNNNNNNIKRNTINFKKRQESSDQSDEATTEVEDKLEQKHKGLKFRNYVPRDISLTQYRLPKSKVPPVVEELLEKLKILESSAESQQSEESISFLPKKANWDLKRDVEKKLSKLDKKTNRAIYDLIKQKLDAEESSNMDLLTRAINKY